MHLNRDLIWEWQVQVSWNCCFALGHHPMLVLLLAVAFDTFEGGLSTIGIGVSRRPMQIAVTAEPTCTYGKGVFAYCET